MKSSSCKIDLTALAHEKFANQGGIVSPITFNVSLPFLPSWQTDTFSLFGCYLFCILLLYNV